MNSVSKQQNGLPLVKTNQPLQLGSRFQSLIDANPYRSAGLNYKESPWQKFLSSMGFRTSADAYRENMAVQADEYDAQIAQQAYAEQYNSPVEEMARMKAAGLNPDISGGQGISAGEAQTPNQDPSLPIGAEADDPLNLLGGFANMVMSAFSTTIGLVSSMQGINANHLKNTFQALTNEKEFNSFVRSVAPILTPDSPEDEVWDDGTAVSWKNRAYSVAKSFARKNLPKKFRQKFFDNITAYWNSAPGTKDAFDEWYKGVKSQKDYYSEKNTFYSTSPDTMQKIYKHLGSAREAIVSLKMRAEGDSASAESAEAQLREDVAENTNGKIVGEGNTAEAKSKKARQDIQSILKGTLDDILRDLKGNQDFFSQALVTILSLYSLTGEF